ncbi:hypothetical protein OSTOST_14329 [Ostertagia ostertagi]
MRRSHSYSTCSLLQTVLRIWDCMIYDGNDVWLFRVSLCLIRANQRRISESKTLDQLIRVFRDITESRKALYCHQLIESAKMERVSQKMIDELRSRFVTGATDDDIDIDDPELVKRPRLSLPRLLR